MDITKLLIGLLVAGAAFYIRSAYLLAQRQRLVATRLHAYLSYWQSWVKEHDFFSLYNLGVEWNAEERAIVKKGEGAKGLVALEDRKRALVKEAVKSYMEEQEAKAVGDTELIATIKQSVASSHGGTVDQMQHALELFEQNLLDGKTFISDDDASVYRQPVDLSNYLFPSHSSDLLKS
jgi:hypothetical protein